VHAQGCTSPLLVVIRLWQRNFMEGSFVDIPRLTSL
jgi:hypothetical protein